ncbi:MAG: PilZ domain-containing protein [Candidatus Tectomicrobia bacterium]|uniref:PilZ domain-containing protein n=1 Tax=Tectimicrobiota bacterium TaxID=2528274 RepID=A0A932HXH1_UNCTE|nr:PilZ domain-containing protein [Candidatus Tectomicrobia bacterium]
MSAGEERREHGRHRIPVVIDAPSVSELPFIPDDVSAGGFCVTSARRPEMGETFVCSIQAGDEVFRNCVAEVVWARGSAGKWNMGISVKSIGSDRARLASLLQGLAERLGLAMRPDY